MAIELTDEQLDLKRRIIHWYRHYGQGKPYYYYSGAAGTGKTTVIHSIVEELGLKKNEYIGCAYVGKAVLVLLRHGINASTIHSLIYTPMFVTEKTVIVDEYGDPKEVRKKKMKFVLKNSLPKELKLIIVDECAMVNDQMRNDILSFGIPVIMMGDQNQLPPVFGSSSILDFPDYVLTKIMRQAENDPIVYLSQCILNNKPIEYGMYGASQVVSHMPIDRRVVTDYDMIICAKNKTREQLNDRIREDVFHYHDRKPMIGDKIICRQNNWDENLNGIYLTNGLVGNITNIDYCSMYRDVLYIDFQPDFMDESFEQLSVDYKYLKADFAEKKDFGFTELEKFEYAYAITAHLSQGSEYPRVLFMDEKFFDPETLKRLRYTAITRARNAITYVKMEEPKKFYQTYKYNNFSYNLPVSP